MSAADGQFDADWARANGVPYNDAGWVSYVARGQSGAPQQDVDEAQRRAAAGLSTGGSYGATAATGANPTYGGATYAAPNAPTAPSAPAAAPAGAAAPKAPTSTIPGVTAPAGAPSGAYGEWLEALKAYHPADLGVEKAQNISGTEALDAMLKSTGGDLKLSPFYRSLLRHQLGQAQSGYLASSILQGDAQAPKGAAGTPMSFGQYMADTLTQRGGEGLGMSGFGPYQSGVEPLKAALAVIQAGQRGEAYQGGTNGSAALGADATRAVANRFLDDKDKGHLLEALLSGGLAGPFAGYEGDQLHDLATNPADKPTDAGVWLQQLRDWGHRGYGW